MRLLLPVTAIAALSLAGCREEAKIEGTVKDIWGKPVAEATVRMEGVTEPVTTDADGRFAFVQPAEAGQIRFLAGREGFINNTLKVSTSADPKAEAPVVDIALYPVPGSTGFFAVGPDAYVAIAPVQLKTVGTELGAYTGLPRDPEPVGGSQSFIFSSTASESELARLNLQLHTLEFRDSATVTAVTGDQTVALNLFMAKEKVAFERQTLPMEHHFLLTVAEPLPAGDYAFSTQGVLTSDSPAALAAIPAELQVAYPFRIR